MLFNVHDDEQKTDILKWCQGTVEQVSFPLSLVLMLLMIDLLLEICKIDLSNHSKIHISMDQSFDLVEDLDGAFSFCTVIENFETLPSTYIFSADKS